MRGLIKQIILLVFIILASFFAKKYLKNKPPLYSFVIWIIGMAVVPVSGYFIIISRLGHFLGGHGTVCLMIIISSVFGGYMLERKGWLIGLLIGVPWVLFYLTAFVVMSIVDFLILSALFAIGLFGGALGEIIAKRIRNKGKE
jgi:hypothetical protein